MALTLSGTNGVVGAGFTLDPSGVSVTAGVGTFTSLQGSAASLTQIPAANIVGVCTSGLTKTGGFGKFASYAIIADQKTQNSGAGTFTSGSFQHRDLNTILYNPDSIVTLSSNDFTLQAGSYFVRASAPAFAVNRHMALLRNHTDSTNIQTGTSEYVSHSQGGANSRSFISARFTLDAAKALRITHKCETTRSGNGFGVESNMSTETYTVVEIFKEA